MPEPPVFIAGGTGYLGRRLIPLLTASGREVLALVRPGSESRLPAGCRAIPGDALQSASYRDRVPPGCTFVHLVGVPHPSPAKAAQFESIDRVSAFAAVQAASLAPAAHFVYVSVAQPAPVMRAYQRVRSACEAEIRRSGLNATILRPWYVLGPGHRWPYLLLPAYWLAERFPATRAGARRLGLVTLEQMAHALLRAVMNPAAGVRVVEVPGIRGNPRQ